MTLAVDSTDIETAFKSAWGTTTPVAYENRSFTVGTVKSWVRFCNLESSARQSSLGNNPMYRYFGMIVVQVFTELGVGAGKARQLADRVTTIFRSNRIGTFQFGVPVVVQIGPNDGWYQLNVDCPYYREET